MYGIEFDMSDLRDEVKLTRQSISKAMKKFSNCGMVKIRKEGRTWFYSINEESPLVKRLEDFDNSLIEVMLGDEKFKEIKETHEKRMRVAAMEKAGAEKIPVRQDLEGGITQVNLPGSSGSQCWWDDGKPKSETDITKPYGLTAFPQIPIGSGAQ